MCSFPPRPEYPKFTWSIRWRHALRLRLPFHPADGSIPRLQTPLHSCSLRRRKLNSCTLLLTSFGFAHEQAAQPEKHQARLAAHHVPQQTSGLITVDIAERLPGRSVEQIDQL